MSIAELQQLRSLLVPLVDSFEIDDPSRGLLALVPVVGGTFVHPLSRQTITELKIYGAGKDKVKILQPVFLRSLPAFSVLGFSHPSQLCAAVAKMLGETLGALGKLRDEIASMGISLDLEHDILRLRGNIEIHNTMVEVVTRMPDSLMLTQLGAASIHAIEPSARTLVLSRNAQNDLDELARMVHKLQAIIDSPKQQNPTQERPAQGRFAEGTSDVMILTELVEEEPSPDTGKPALEPVPKPEKKSNSDKNIDGEQGQIEQGPQDQLPALRIDYLFEMTGADTEIWAHMGRLRLKIPFKVVQGEYVFYLEQVEQKQFKGVLVSPQGTRHPVDVDFTSIMDIKEVFDRIMLGK